MITSNYETPDKLIGGLTSGSTINAAQTARLRDRVAGALLGHVVEGDSYRIEKQASQSPWWLAAEVPPWAED